MIPLYVATFLLTICLHSWPRSYWPRYLVPFAPFFVWSLVECLVALGRRASKASLNAVRSAGRLLVPLVLGLIVVVQVPSLYRLDAWSREEAVSYDYQGGPTRYRLFLYADEYRALDEGLDWLRQRIRPGEIVATAMPHWAYLRLGSKTVMPPSECDPATMQKLLDSVPVEYVVVARPVVDAARDYTLPFPEHAKDRWTRVYGHDDGALVIYERSSN